MKIDSYIYIKTILIFVILSVVYFYIGLNKKFYQYSYQWSSEQNTKDLGSIKILGISFSSIEIQADLISKEHPLHYNSIYKLNTTDDLLYFKSANIIQTDSSIILSSLNWLNHPPNNYEVKEGNLYEVYIPFKDKGDISVQVIGNQEIWWKEGRRLRYLMNDENHKLSFVGTNSDAYGFKHEGHFSKSLSELNEKIEILPANIYVLKVFSDYKSNDDNTLFALDSIIEKILNRNEVNPIIIITPFPSLNIHYNEKNQRLRDLLINKQFLSNGNIIVLDSFKIYSESLNDEIFLNDGIGFTKKGYSILAKSLTNVIAEVYK